MSKSRIDISGQRFGRLTAIEATGAAAWLFKCDCGAEKSINGKNVRRGLVKSCGCLRKETSAAMGRGNLTHGHAADETPEYRAWHHAKDRCSDKNNPRYGGRGIRMCEEWERSFEAFLAHIGQRPTPAHSLDRYPDNDGHYEPGNVRWATQQEQARNRSSNHIVLLAGGAVCLAEAIEAKGLNTKRVRARLSNGWAMERALA